MQYLTSLRSSLHQRGILALLLAGCLLGFGLGQTLGASYGPHAYRSYRAPTGGVGAAAATSRANGGLGNNVATQQQQMTGARSHASAATQGQSMSLVAPSQQATSASSGTASGKGQAKQDNKSHQKGKRKGSDSPKTKGHRKGDDGGRNATHGKDDGDQGHATSGADGGRHHASDGNGHKATAKEMPSLAMSLSTLGPDQH